MIHKALTFAVVVVLTTLLVVWIGQGLIQFIQRVETAAPATAEARMAQRIPGW